MQLWGGSNDCTSDGHLKGNSWWNNRKWGGNGKHSEALQENMHCSDSHWHVRVIFSPSALFFFFFYRPSCDVRKSCEQHAPSSVFMQALSPVLSCVSSSSSFTIDEQNRKALNVSCSSREPLWWHTVGRERRNDGGRQLLSQCNCAK